MPATLRKTVQSAEDSTQRAQVLQSIEKEIQELPARQREAFLMRYWEEMDVAETAAMGCSGRQRQNPLFSRHPDPQQGIEGQRNRVMTTSTPPKSVADRFGRKIAARLNAGQADLPYVVTERLRASRARSARKRVSTVARPAQEATLHSVQMGADGSATLGTGPSGWMPQWLRHALTALPIAAMVAGTPSCSKMPAPPWKWPSSTPSC
jgi:hypothetical protein